MKPEMPLFFLHRVFPLLPVLEAVAFESSEYLFKALKLPLLFSRGELLPSFEAFPSTDAFFDLSPAEKLADCLRDGVNIGCDELGGPGWVACACAADSELFASDDCEEEPDLWWPEVAGP